MQLSGGGTACRWTEKCPSLPKGHTYNSLHSGLRHTRYQPVLLLAAMPPVPFTGKWVVVLRLGVAGDTPRPSWSTQRDLASVTADSGDSLAPLALAFLGVECPTSHLNTCHTPDVQPHSTEAVTLPKHGGSYCLRNSVLTQVGNHSLELWDLCTHALMREWAIAMGGGMKKPRLSSTSGVMVAPLLTLTLTERACCSVQRSYQAALAICSRVVPCR